MPLARPDPAGVPPPSPQGRERAFLPDEPWMDMLIDRLCGELEPGILTFEMDELMQRTTEDA